MLVKTLIIIVFTFLAFASVVFADSDKESTAQGYQLELAGDSNSSGC